MDGGKLILSDPHVFFCGCPSKGWYLCLVRGKDDAWCAEIQYVASYGMLDQAVLRAEYTLTKAEARLTRKVDISLPGKGDSNSHGARPVC